MKNFEELYMKKYANPENQVNVNEYKSSIKSKVEEYSEKTKKLYDENAPKVKAKVKVLQKKQKKLKLHTRKILQKLELKQLSLLKKKKKFIRRMLQL